MQTKLLVIEKAGSDHWGEVKEYLSKRRGFEMLPVQTATSALKALNSEDISIIISDYSLPRVNAYKFLRKIKQIKPHVEVIFLSESTSLSNAINIMKEGAYDFYEFPLNMRLLMTVIGKAIEKQELFMEKQGLEEKVKEMFEFTNIIGRSKPMQEVISRINSISKKNVNVLIQGETGTGKELIANAVHYHSPRSSKPFIKVNCAAFNEGVLESELFGHERGSFTGAISQRIGRFELANGGTVFLDEVSDISHGTQIKLLRVLQEKEFERVGGNLTIKTDVRVIAATNKNLKDLVDRGLFREDLFYRLNVVNVNLPPLRERKEDIPLLVSYFINKINDEKGYRFKGINKEGMRILHDYSWPGNVRELENALESAMALSEDDIIEAKYLPSLMLMTSSVDGDFYHLPMHLSLDEINGEIIKIALQRYGGNKSLCSRKLGIGLRTLQRKLKNF